MNISSWSISSYSGHYQDRFTVLLVMCRQTPVDWWEDLVTGIAKPLHAEGFAHVPEGPGLGIELNLDAVKEHLDRGQELFAPTDEWDRDRSNDRLWS